MWRLRMGSRRPSTTFRGCSNGIGLLKKRIDSPAVSVVIPTFNRAADLQRCLESLVAQTRSDFEVLVCDDGSTDGTADVITPYQQFLDLTYSNDINSGGPARPRNRGIGKARAPYIAFLDSDDWWAPAKLERSLAALDAGADVVYHDLWNVTSASQTNFRDRVRADPPVSPLYSTMLCSGLSIPNSSVVVRASLLQAIGGICEEKSLIAVEDFDTWLRVSQLTENFFRLPDCLGFYWNAGGNISTASERQIRRTEAVYQRHLANLSEGDRRRAKSFLAYRIGRMAQLSGDWTVATERLSAACRGDIPWRYRLKALWLLSFQRYFST